MFCVRCAVVCPLPPEGRLACFQVSQLHVTLLYTLGWVLCGCEFSAAAVTTTESRRWRVGRVLTARNQTAPSVRAVCTPTGNERGLRSSEPSQARGIVTVPGSLLPAGVPWSDIATCRRPMACAAFPWLFAAHSSLGQLPVQVFAHF